MPENQQGGKNRKFGPNWGKGPSKSAPMPESTRKHDNREQGKREQAAQVWSYEPGEQPQWRTKLGTEDNQRINRQRQ